MVQSSKMQVYGLLCLCSYQSSISHPIFSRHITNSPNDYSPPYILVDTPYIMPSLRMYYILWTKHLNICCWSLQCFLAAFIGSVACRHDFLHKHWICNCSIMLLYVLDTDGKIDWLKSDNLEKETALFYPRINIWQQFMPSLTDRRPWLN